MATDPDLSPDLLLEEMGFLRRLARGLVWGADQAEDLVQEAVAIALHNAPRDRSSLRSWLGRVTRNVAHRAHRGDARRRHRERRSQALGEVASTAEVVAQQELFLRIGQSVRGLPEPYRSAIHHRYYEDLSPAEIARRQELPVATVKTRLRRGLRMLRHSLDERHGGDRRSWCLPLVPLSGLPPAAVTAGVAGPSLTGMALMASRSRLIFATGGIVFLGVLGWALWPQPEDAESTLPPGQTAADVAALTNEDGERQPIPRAAEEAFSGVSGRVVDQAGPAVEGAELRFWIGPYDQWNRTERLTTDDEGRFRLTLTAPQEVSVMCEDQRWDLVNPWPRIQAPAENVELVVKRLPTGKVILRVRDLSTGEPVQRFTVGFSVSGKGYGWPGEGSEGWRGGYFGKTTETGVLEQFVRVHEGPEPTAVQMDLSEPGRVRHRLYLREGDVAVVEIPWESGPEIRGLVTDLQGIPIAGALVYAGGQILARGDEPFKPFVASRIRNGSRTDAEGSFSLRSDGATHLTVWHPDHTPATLPVGNAYRVQLQPRGGIRGRLVDAAGRARAGVSIALDRETRTVTDRDGRFSFEHVEAGIRGLHLATPGSDRLPAEAGGLWSVRVEPGEITDLLIDPGIAEVALRIRSGGESRPRPRQGLVIGSDRLASLAFGQIRDGLLELRGVIPGEYVFLSEQGHVSHCRIQGPNAAVDLGTADLVVEADAGTRLYLVPAGANELVRLMAARIAMRRVPDSGELAFGPLPVGAYELFRDGEEAGELVHVAGAGTRFALY